MKKYRMLVLSVALLLGITACNQTLQPGGAYAPAVTNSAGEVQATAAPDLVLFKADSVFDVAYTSLKTILGLEQTNRALLWKVSPDIKKTMDKCRVEVVPILQKWAIARKAYIASPTPENMTSIQGIIAEVQRVLTAAQTAMPQ